MSIDAVQGTNPAARGYEQLGALVRACRPRQWSKNLLVLAAPGAAGVLGHPDVAGKLAVAFVSFCMISSATYLFNDLHDRAEDRLNPRCCERPLASGALGVAPATTAAVLLALGGLTLAAYLHWQLAAVAAGYLVLTGSYTLWLRRIAVADIAAIAGGFVLRALAGGAATDVAVSRWFMLVTSFGALFVVAGKRYAELYERETTTGSAHQQSAEPMRASLREYSTQYLRFVVGLAATVTTTAYCLWAFQRAHQARLSWYELTIVPFVLWLLRYGLLLDRGDGHSPEEIILGDGFLLAMSAMWLATFVCGVYVAG